MVALPGTFTGAARRIFRSKNGFEDGLQLYLLIFGANTAYAKVVLVGVALQPSVQRPNRVGQLVKEQRIGFWSRHILHHALAKPAQLYVYLVGIAAKAMVNLAKPIHLLAREVERIAEKAAVKLYAFALGRGGTPTAARSSPIRIVDMVPYCCQRGKVKHHQQHDYPYQRFTFFGFHIKWYYSEVSKCMDSSEASSMKAISALPDALRVPFW